MNYAGSSAGGVTKYEYATRLAACLAYMMVHQADGVGLTTFDTKIRRYIPPRSQGQPPAGHSR